LGTTTSILPLPRRTRHASPRFDRVHQQQPVHRKIGEGQRRLIGQCDLAGAARRPGDDALLRRRHRHDAAGLGVELAQIGRRMAEAQHRQAAHVRPEIADATANEAQRHLAEMRAVEFVEVDDVVPHGVEP